MKTLHNYLLRQVLATLLLTVAVFTFVLLLGNVLKEIIGYLVNGQIGLGVIVIALALLIPWVLVFALPTGMLAATLLVFGRFSADNELTAVRSSGVSLISLVSPILLFSLLLSGVCAWINMEAGPRCRVAYKETLASIEISQLQSMLQEKTYIKDIKNYIVYADSVDGLNLKDLLIYKLEGDRVESFIRASEGKLEVQKTNNLINITLYDYWQVWMNQSNRMVGGKEFTLTYTNNPSARRKYEAALTDKSFLQLWDELRAMEKRLAQPVGKLTREALADKIREEQRREQLTLPIKVQIHRQLSFSFACLGFTLIGIPLGIRAHRRETSIGLAMALILLLVYYSFIVVATGLSTRPEWYPHLILWVPNFFFQVVGGVLLWRANKGV